MVWRLVGSEVIRMKTKTKAILTTVAVAVPSFIIGAGTPVGAPLWRAVWPFHMGDVDITWQLPIFMAVGALEAVAFGLGVAFAFFGAPLARRIAPGRRPGLFVAAVTWSLGNWWMHDSLHITNGMDATGLMIIDVAFHGTLIAAAAIVAWGLVQGAAARQPGTGGNAPMRGRLA